MIGGNIEWQNKNALRAYPLEDSVISFIHDILLDIFIIFQEDDVYPYVSEIIKTPVIVSVSFRCKASGKTLFVAQKIGKEGFIHPAPGIDCSGNVTFGDCDNIRDGRYTYDVHSYTSLLDHCYVCIGNPIIKTIAAPGSTRMSGNVGINFVGSFTQAIEGQYREILGEKNILNVGLGDNKNQFTNLCYPAKTTCECDTKPIKQINNVSPDRNGNITIESKDMIVIIDNSAPFSSIYFSAIALPEDKCKLNAFLPDPDGTLQSSKK